MKICFITSTMSGGGAERVIANLSNELVSREHEVTILLTTAMIVEYNLDSRVELVQISERTGHGIKGRIKRIYNLRKYFAKHRECNYISMPTDTNIFVLIASMFLPINLIISERNDPNQYEYPLLRDILYITAKKIVFQTEDAKQCFSKRIQKRSKVILNPVSDNLPSAYEGKKEKKIVTVGRLDPQKNQILLIKAFEKFVESHGNYELDIYGKGELENALHSFIKELNLSEKVHLKGFSKELWQEAATAEMFILSSDYEGMPNSLIEAMAMGMAVVSTDCPIGGSAMLIKHRENGLLVPIRDADELCAAMIELAEHKELIDRYGKNAISIRQDLSVSKICNQWLEYLKQ